MMHTFMKRVLTHSMANVLKTEAILFLYKETMKSSMIKIIIKINLNMTLVGSALFMTVQTH